MIMGMIGVFSAYFYMANQRQRSGKRVLEGTEGFRFTY
jgi:hypothetical protein